MGSWRAATALAYGPSTAPSLAGPVQRGPRAEGRARQALTRACAAPPAPLPQRQDPWHEPWHIHARTEHGAAAGRRRLMSAARCWRRNQKGPCVYRSILSRAGPHTCCCKQHWKRGRAKLCNTEWGCSALNEEHAGLQISEWCSGPPACMQLWGRATAARAPPQAYMYCTAECDSPVAGSSAHGCCTAGVWGNRQTRSRCLVLIWSHPWYCFGAGWDMALVAGVLSGPHSSPAHATCFRRLVAAGAAGAPRFLAAPLPAALAPLPRFCWHVARGGPERGVGNDQCAINMVGAACKRPPACRGKSEAGCSGPFTPSRPSPPASPLTSVSPRERPAELLLPPPPPPPPPWRARRATQPSPAR